MSKQHNAPRFLFPVHGDVMVGEADGEWVNGGLKIHVLLDACGEHSISVNGIPAQKGANGTASADVVLHGRTNRLVAFDNDTGESETITVYVFPEAYHKYRFTVDDFIRGFQDLNEHQHEYASIFDNAYLNVFKQAHDRYGSRAHINAFYETQDKSFNLSMMTDRYRAEFEANADWLTFSFHARNEMPDKPYLNKSFDEVRADCLLVTNELRRIVGSAPLSNTTTLHWGDCNVQGTRALRSVGYRGLCGYLHLCQGEPQYAKSYQKGDTVVSYHLTQEQVSHADHRCFFADVDEDVIFAKIQVVLNAADLTADRVEACLDELSKRPSESGFIQMVIHEQYFYPDYAAYEPDYAQRILTMAKWMYEHNYKPASLSEIINKTAGM